ncbi:hypothetical protein ACFC09_04805 [Streptomyces sp. NPDC056161]|uniref:hypothetical protein n=1 Tax=Streptomyces sp. NPDC056161 TaxID=3345732 RepID=UPI0035E002CE
MSAGYGLNNRVYRAVGFGHLAAYSAEKAAESFSTDQESAATNLATAVGTAVWAGGIGAGNRIMQVAGPAVNTASSLTSAVLKWREGKEEWRRELFDVAEMAAFTAGGYTGNPVARAVAFGSAAAGFFYDATQDKSLIGHGLGAAVWAVGAGVENNSVQSIGAGVVAAAEAARLVYPLYEKYAQKSSDSAMELPRYEPVPRRHSTAKAGPEPQTSVLMPVSPVTEASVLHTSAAYISSPPAVYSPDQSTASSPGLPPASSPGLPAAPSPDLLATSSPVLWANPTPTSHAAAYSPTPSAVSSPVPATAFSLMLPTASSPFPLTAPPAISPTAPQRYAPPLPASTCHSAAGGGDNVFSRPSSAPARMSVPTTSARAAGR